MEADLNLDQFEDFKKDLYDQMVRQFKKQIINSDEDQTPYL